MKKYTVFFAAVLLLAFSAMVAWPQAQSAKVQGKVTDNGKPVPDVQVVFTAAATGKVSKMKTDSTGAYSGVGFSVGEYKVQIIGASGESLFTVNKTQITMDGGAATVLNIDLTKDRASGKPALTQEQIEAIKAQNAKATALNALIMQAQNALNARQWQEAIDPLRKMIDLDPSRPEYYQALGNAQFNLEHYPEAADAFEKGIAASQNAPSNPKADPAKTKAMLGQMLTMEGNTYLKLGKTDQAIALFGKAAAIDPNPGTAYFNLCATQYNAGQMDAAVLSCDKAIAVDPNKADAYFIKGSALFGSGKFDANNKYIVPPGTVDALKKYLDLAPEGGHAGDVKAMLEALDIKVETTFGKKKK
jgi:tetratricopeptide (TPR) repeat protein